MRNVAAPLRFAPLVPPACPVCVYGSRWLYDADKNCRDPVAVAVLDDDEENEVDLSEHSQSNLLNRFDNCMEKIFFPFEQCCHF